jgi:hypothetical protein
MSNNSDIMGYTNTKMLQTHNSSCTQNNSAPVQKTKIKSLMLELHPHHYHHPYSCFVINVFEIIIFTQTTTPYRRHTLLKEWSSTSGNNEISMSKSKVTPPTTHQSTNILVPPFFCLTSINQPWLDSPIWASSFQGYVVLRICGSSVTSRLAVLFNSILMWPPESSGRQSGDLGEKWPLWISLTSITGSIHARKVLLHAVNLRLGADGFTSPPKEVVLRIFITLKNPLTSVGIEPANLGSSGSTLTTSPPRSTFAWHRVHIWQGILFILWYTNY